MQIKESIHTQDTNRYGKLIPHKTLNDTIWYLYRHPEYSVKSENYSEALTLQLIDTATKNVLKSAVLEILNVPVILIHGIWSDSSAFAKMEKALIQTNRYDEDLVIRLDYHSTHAHSFVHNKLVVPTKIKEFKSKLTELGISVGKVDIVAHSMGGLLSRYYLQSLLYKDDIHRFIGLNVPHSGTLFANYLWNSPKLSITLTSFGWSTHKGAVEDFKVNSYILNYIINGHNLNHKIVPSHSIITRTQRPVSEKDKRMIYEPSIVTSLLGFDFIKNLHGEDNDEIVGYSSQSGGLQNENISVVDGQVHAGSSANKTVINRVIDLLKSPINDASFSHTGFKPVKLRSQKPSACNSFLK